MLFFILPKDKETPKKNHTKEHIELGKSIAELIKIILEIITKFL